MALPLRRPVLTSLVILPVLAAIILGFVVALAPERRWPPDADEKFALCIVYVDQEDRIQALHPDWDDSIASVQVRLNELADEGARFLLPAVEEKMDLTFSDGGTFRYQIITPPARNPQVLRTRCDTSRSSVVETTYEASSDRLDLLQYSVRPAFLAVYGRILAVILVLVLPVLYVAGISERRHEERRRGARRRAY